MAEIRHSVCALDCPDCCSLVLTVQDGHATRLRGNPEHPVTRGFLCGKVAQYLEREYHPERLLYPRRRVGAKGAGRFERIAWDEALDTIAGRLRAVADEFGSEAILPYSYGGSMGLLNGSGMDRCFFHRLGASRLDRTICSSAGGVGVTPALGARYGTEPEQFRHAKLIIAWGANILGTNVHLWPFVMEARRNGAKLYTIDPNRNRTGAASDKHFFINPGSDIALALAMMHVIVGEGLHDADYVARYTEGFDGLRDRVRAWTPQRAAELTGIAPGGDGKWERRGGGPATLHLAGVPPESRRPGAGRFRASGAGPRGAPGQHVAAGAGADHAGQSAGEGVSGLQLQPRRYRAKPERRAARPAPRGSVHRGAGAVSDGHRGSRRYRAAGDHVAGAHRPVPGLRPLLPADGAAGAGRAGRDQEQRRDLPPAGRPPGLRRRVLRGYR